MTSWVMGVGKEQGKGGMERGEGAGADNIEASETVYGSLYFPDHRAQIAEI